SAPVDTPDLADETGSGAGANCALAFCRDGYTCRPGDGCVLDGPVVFSEDIAGVGPNDGPFFYWLSRVFSGESLGEYYHEAGISIQEGDVEAAEYALEGLSDALAEAETEIEGSSGYNIEGLTLDTFTQSSVASELADDFGEALVYTEYIDNLQIVLEGQVDSGVVDVVEVETVLGNAQRAVSEVSGAVEERRIEVIEGVARASDASTFEVGNEFRDFAYERDPSLQDRFQRIANTQTVQEVRDEIESLYEEANQLEESGDSQRASSIRSLIETALSHATECLHASQDELDGLEGFGHIGEAQQLVDNAQLLVEGAEVSDLDLEVLNDVEPPTAEELQVATQREIEIADAVIDDYADLTEEYADDPVQLAALDAERERALRAQQLGQQLYANGVMEQWITELTEQGLTGADIDEVIHGRWTAEWRTNYGEESFGPGMIARADDVLVDGES
ncbi:MAG: hypothetical protein AAB590_00830, partial [Patescibacteria group bacterium]